MTPFFACETCSGIYWNPFRNLVHLFIYAVPSMLQISIVPVTDFQQNCSIVFDDQTKNGVVVDPGGDVERIAGAVSELGVKVQAIWLTHGHLDHAGSAEAAKKQFGVDIIGPHADDKMLLDNIEMAAANYDLKGYFNATPDLWLDGGDKLNIDEHEFEIRHCPGHAPGHVIYINHANKVILMGDVLFQGPSAARTYQAAITSNCSTAFAIKF